MDSLILITISILTITILILFSPFLRYSKDRIKKNISSMDEKDLLERKKLLLERYLLEEEAFSKKQISLRVWNQRKEFLLHRYIDISRRLDWLQKKSAKMILFFLFLFNSVLGFSATKLCDKGEGLDVSHAMIMDPSVEQLYFSYWLQISNSNRCMLDTQITLFMPKGIKEWRVQESKLPQDAFRVNEDGMVQISVSAEPDFKEVVSLFLRAEFPSGGGKLEFPFETSQLKELVLLLPKIHEQLKLGGDFLMVDEVQLGRSRMLQFQVSSGDRTSSTLEISGIQRGRTQTHNILFAGAGLLVLLAVFGIWRVRAL